MNPTQCAPHFTTLKIFTALNSLRQGQGILVKDAENRENEADLIFAAQWMTNEKMALLIRECVGIVCLCLPSEKIAQLELPMMVEQNTSAHQTAFTVSIDAKTGITTGVSAADRTRTILTAISDTVHPDDLARPGHVFPLQAHPKGVLGRQGHTEAAVDLMRLAGLKPYGVICELINPDGTMARGDQIAEFSAQHRYPIISVADLVQYRMAYG